MENAPSAGSGSKIAFAVFQAIHPREEKQTQTHRYTDTHTHNSRFSKFKKAVIMLSLSAFCIKMYKITTDSSALWKLLFLFLFFAYPIPSSFLFLLLLSCLFCTILPWVQFPFVPGKGKVPMDLDLIGVMVSLYRLLLDKLREKLDIV